MRCPGAKLLQEPLLGSANEKKFPGQLVLQSIERGNQQITPFALVQCSDKNETNRLSARAAQHLMKYPIGRVLNLHDRQFWKFPFQIFHREIGLGSDQRRAGEAYSFQKGRITKVKVH